MGDVKVELALHGGVNLRAIARELAAMDDRKVTALFKKRLEDAAAPFPLAVRRSVLAIPTTGTRHTGLRARIAQCAEVASWTDGRSASVAVEINPKRMAPDYLSLPLYMEGATPKWTRWRHPVFGRWLAGQPNQDPHPYFYQAASGFGAAAAVALEAALGDVTDQLSG